MQGGRLKVGMVASLTGQFCGQGSQSLQGAAAWARDVNALGGISAGNRSKLSVQLTSYDDQSTAQVARAMTQKLIVDDRVDLLLGPYSSSLTLAVAPIAEEFQKVLWNHGGASDRIYSQGFRWVVGVLTPASRYLIGIVDLVKQRDSAARRLAILHSNKGTFPLAVASGLECYAAQEGFQTVFKCHYQSPLADFSSVLSLVESSEPDVIVGVGRIGDDLLLADQIVRRKTRAKLIALVAAGIGQFTETLGESAEGFVGPSQWEPGNGLTPEYGPSARDLAIRHAMFREGGGDYAVAQAFATCLVAQRCVEDTGTLDNHTLRDKANQLDFSTFYGRFKLDPATGCQVGRSVLLVQWQGGKKPVIWPRELRQADLLYPSHLYST